MQAPSDRILTTCVDRWDAVAGLDVQWNALLARCPQHSVFQTYDWQLCWWKAFHAGHELFLVLAHRDGELVGIAPLMLVRRGNTPGRDRSELHFIGSTNGAADYCDLITDPTVEGVARALLDAAEAGATGIHRIDLSHLPGASPNRAAILEHFSRRGARLLVEFQADAPALVLGDAGPDLKAANKSSLKRLAKYFQRTGTLRCLRCGSEAEVLGFLDAFFEQHRARRAQTDAPSQFLDPAQRDFYCSLVTEAFRHGWLRFDVLLLDGVPLAFHFGFEYRDRFLYYKPTFDVRHAARSPGKLLLEYLLDDAIERGLEEFDFGVGAEAYKFRFANRIRRNERIIVFGSVADSWAYRGMSGAKAIARRLLGRPTGSRAPEPLSQTTAPVPGTGKPIASAGRLQERRLRLTR